MTNKNIDIETIQNQSAYGLSAELRKAVQDIKQAILRSQYDAAKATNAVSISLNYGIGQYVSVHSRNGYWGKGAVESISEQLRKELPGLRGYSAANIKFMRQFYETWCVDLKSLTAVSEIPNDKTLTAVSEINPFQLNSDPDSAVESFSMETFLSIGFTHHMTILRNTTTLDERLFYIRQTYQNHWNKETLAKKIKVDDLYHHQSAIPNNFSQTIPSRLDALKAVEMFKDEYLLDFINVEEIGARDAQDVDERVVEKKIIQNVKNFIMTFGHDFTFVGNQYHLEKFGVEQFPDLLFYNRELAALVVVELKFGEFKPAYLGQLSSYLRILDSEVKKPFENPSIGIVLCKSANKSFVEFLIQGYNNPMGVATYKTADDVRKVLPSETELQYLLDNGTEETSDDD